MRVQVAGKIKQVPPLIPSGVQPESSEYPFLRNRSRAFSTSSQPAKCGSWSPKIVMFFARQNLMMLAILVVLFLCTPDAVGRNGQMQWKICANAKSGVTSKPPRPLPTMVRCMFIGDKDTHADTRKG